MEALDHAWRDGLADELGALFAEDAHELLNNRAAVVGRKAIVHGFAQLAAAFDTSSYAPRYDIVDVRGNHAYVLGSFDEVLRPRAGGPGTRVRGRIVLFWRREGDGRWRIVRFLTGRSEPEELEA
jgi:ketosteroid isomerase-like protein